MGATHFLMKTLPRVASEMALHVLAYNLTRVMNIMGVESSMVRVSISVPGVRSAGKKAPPARFRVGATGGAIFARAPAGV